jgi:hypothetical protein
MKFYWLLVQLACSTALMVQLGFVIWNGFIRPSVTNTVVEQRNMKDMDLPVVLKICIAPGFDHVALIEAGYLNVYDYFYGYSKYNTANSTMIGWAGHTNTSRPQADVNKILNRVRAHTLEEVVSDIRVYTYTEGIREGLFFPINITEAHYLSVVNYPHNCYTLDLTRNSVVKEHSINALYISFSNFKRPSGKDLSVKVIVQDSSLVCDRNIKDHLAYSEGAEIRLDKMNVRREYVVKIKKTVFVKEDPTKVCQNYPTSDYVSYRDCDDQWMKNGLARDAPGLVPFWLTNDWKKVTTGYLPSSTGFFPFPFGDLFSGDVVSDCLLPCTTVHTETRFSEEAIDDKTQVSLAFSPTVEVTTTDLVKPTLSNFLSDVGGSVGLWLGIGMVQAVEIVINFVLPILSRYRSCRKA